MTAIDHWKCMWYIQILDFKQKEWGKQKKEQNMKHKSGWVGTDIL